MLNIVEKNSKTCNNLIAFQKSCPKSKSSAKKLQKILKQDIIKAHC